MAVPSDTAMTPTTPSDTTVGQYPTPTETDTTGGMGTDTTSVPPDTGAYVPDTGAAGVDTTGYGGAATDTSSVSPDTGGYGAPGADTSGVDSGMGTDTHRPLRPTRVHPTRRPTPPRSKLGD